ncbi:MAG: hypothetical protein JSV89_04960 [Spirochaetaceae bacterium]|nr:MAG: hypothetical protein JSV89_04960 [Spirochaetaceae bacterium]
MAKRIIFLFPLLFIPTSLSYAFAMPETSITRTHLMKDIDPASVTIGIGMEFVSEDPDPLYNADFLFGYLGYAPFDWSEFGIAFHTAWISFFPAVEAKIDLVDIFTDASRISCLLMGGIGAYSKDDGFDPIYHGGIAVNFRPKRSQQLYAGAGTDSLAKALNLQVGLYFELLDWLGLSMNFKLVIGPDGTEPMFSAAPLAVID